MKKMIYFCGNMDYSFFLNEIQYLKKYFEKIHIITYEGNRDKYDKISKKYNLKYEVADNIKIISFFYLSFFKWLLKKETIAEIRKNFSLSKKGIKRVLYILLYGNFTITIEKMLDKILEKDKDKTEILLYSYWFSRGAYSFTYYKKTHKNLNIEVVSRAHGYDLYEERNDVQYLPFRFYLNENIDKIFFISKNGLDYYHSKYGFNYDSKYFVIRLGTENKQNLKKIIKSKKKICIASCSSVIEIKRLDLIIKILSQLKINYHWIHIGEGKLFDKIKLEAFKNLSKDKFTFIGKLNNEDILKMYIENDVDYFINLSDSEGIPVSMMEAISLGIPCIGRNVGGMNEIIDKDSGLLLSDIDSKIIEEFLSMRINNPEQYKVISYKSLKKWKEFYDANKNYNNFIDDIKGKII